MECSQLAAWTTNRSLHVASHVKTFSEKATNSDSTLPKVAHVDDGVIVCHRCLHLALGMCSGICRHATIPLRFVPHANNPPTHPILHPTHHSHDKLHTCINCHYDHHMHLNAINYRNQYMYLNAINYFNHYMYMNAINYNNNYVLLLSYHRRMRMILRSAKAERGRRSG